MRGFDPLSTAESAWRAVTSATNRAEDAEQAAERAAEAAARQERLAASGSRGAQVHAHVARAHRASERCQRASAGLQYDFAWLMVGWAARHDPDRATPPVLMHVVARVLGWRDALLSVRDHRGTAHVVAASDRTARRAHELEVDLGEGPSWEAARGRRLWAAGVELEHRWPRYGVAVCRLDVRAVVAVPLRLGAELVGVLTLTGPEEGDHGSLMLEDVAAGLRQCLFPAPEPVAAERRPDPGELSDRDLRPALHQAAGVLHERIGVPLEDAIVLIRVHAYAEDRPLADVAADVLSGGVLES